MNDAALLLLILVSSLVGFGWGALAGVIAERARTRRSADDEHVVIALDRCAACGQFRVIPRTVPLCHQCYSRLSPRMQAELFDAWVIHREAERIAPLAKAMETARRHIAAVRSPTVRHG